MTEINITVVVKKERISIQTLIRTKYNFHSNTKYRRGSSFT